MIGEQTLFIIQSGYSCRHVIKNVFSFKMRIKYLSKEGKE